MRILQVNSVCGIGSTGRIATDIHAMLLEQGHQSYIAYGRDLAKNCDNSISIGNRLDKYAHVALSRFLDQHGFGSKKATEDFVREISRLSPDLIHLHNLHGYYIHIEVLFDYLKQAKKPVIWTLHDCWAFTGHCSYFDFANCNKWKNQCFHCPEVHSYPASFCVDNSENNYKWKKKIFTSIDEITIVTPSDWLARHVKESFLGKYEVRVINNGIDLNIFRPIQNDGMRKRLGLENKIILLGVASTWSKRKGLNYFFEIMKRLSSLAYALVLVGLDKEQINKLPKAIIGIHRTHEIKELAELYSMADMFVNPTLEEVLGLTNLEALACGTPVITFNSGGSPECLGSRTGIVVQKGDLEGLLIAINEVEKNGKSYYLDSCREHVVANFEKSNKYTEYLQLYKLKAKTL